MKGALVIITKPDGRVAAHAVDFEPSEANGFSDLMRQKRRAYEAACRKYVKDYCGEDIGKVVDTYNCVEMVETLRVKLKYHVETFEIDTEKLA